MSRVSVWPAGDDIRETGMLVAAGSVAGIGRLQDARQEPSPDALQKTVARQNDLICSPPPMNAESMPTAQLGGSGARLAAGGNDFA